MTIIALSVIVSLVLLSSSARISPFLSTVYAAVIKCDSSISIYCDGTEEDDHMIGDTGFNFMSGFGGDDKLIGGGGNDDFFGGEGNDVLLGGPGHDELQGDAGDDKIFGGPGDDTLEGNAGADSFVCGSGDQDDVIGFNPAEGDTVSSDCEFY